MKVTLKDNELEVKGTQPKVDERAPDFSLNNLENEEVSLDNLEGETVIVSVFPDITTSVCAQQTRHFFEKASEYEDVRILNISTNDKKELKDWCATEGIDVEMLSDVDHKFGDAYGLYIPEIDALARSVHLIDKEGNLVYSEIVSEMTNEPDYESLFNKVDKL